MIRLLANVLHLSEYASTAHGVLSLSRAVLFVFAIAFYRFGLIDAKIVERLTWVGCAHRAIEALSVSAFATDKSSNDLYMVIIFMVVRITLRGSMGMVVPRPFAYEAAQQLWLSGASLLAWPHRMNSPVKM